MAEQHTFLELMSNRAFLSLAGLWIIGAVVSYIVMFLVIIEVEDNFKLRGKRMRVNMWWLVVPNAWLSLCLSFGFLLVSVPLFFYFKGKNKELGQEDFWH